jgi:hypothetical protein
MNVRGLLKGTSLALALAVCGVLALPATGDEPAKAQEKTKAIDLAICLDTSNSMDGLIGSAKQKLWDIVNELGKAKPTPKLRVALYSYGNDTYDVAKGWVRKELDLTTDLDKVSEKLFGLTTQGGTEYVGRVCRDALDQLDWTRDAGALKLIFVCGNEPASQDPEIQLKPLAESAARKGIIVNTIYCGDPNHSEAIGWKQLADLAEGRYAAINQERGAVAVVTPFDKELTDLSGKINNTFCFWGKDAKSLATNQAGQDANAAQAGNSAQRAISKGGGFYRYEQDLVEKLKSDPKFDVKKVPVEELNDELKKMTPEDREKHVKKLLAEREEIQKKIADLAKKREAWVQAELKKNPNPADKAFDDAVQGALREQGKKKGIEIPEK